MNKKTVKKILRKTEKGYDLISGKFSQTRKNFWSELGFISDYVHERDRILDYGCGNGRLLEIFKGREINYTGVDVSGNLLDIARSNYLGKDIHFQKINSDQIILPFKDNYFNAVYSIAVFHHLPSVEHREKIAQELYRVTKPGGYIIVTVWNLWQSKYRKNIFQNWKKKFKGESNLDWNDCLVSFKDNQNRAFYRYHHAFTLRELKKLFSKVGFKIEKVEKQRGRNLVLVGKKIKTHIF